MGIRDEAAAAIRHHPREAERALDSLPWRERARFTPAAFDATAGFGGRGLVEEWIAALEGAGLLDAFAHALAAQGVAVHLGASTTDPAWGEHIDPAAWRVFLPKLATTRCRILIDGQFAATGSLVGPSLVLTSWHVLATRPPDEEQDPLPKVEVYLADGSRVNAVLPPHWSSPCSVGEYNLQIPRTDAEILSFNDVALLELESYSARHLGHVALPRDRASDEGRTLLLAHFPEGIDPGLGMGRTRRLPNMWSRVSHDVPTQSGSSGGACFNRTGRFVGVHQGVRESKGVFVPVERFVDAMGPVVDRDIGPERLWRIHDGTHPYVIGRDQFTQGISAAALPVDTADPSLGRVRGVWVKGGPAVQNEFGRTYELTRELLLRRGPDHVLVRLSFEQITSDLLGDVRRRLDAVGFTVDGRDDPTGSDPGQAPPEAVSRSKANMLMFGLGRLAGRRGQTVWLFFDDPSTHLTETARLDLEAIVAAALTQPAIRLVITGFRTLRLDGEEFASKTAARGHGRAGLIIEYLAHFRRGDVLNMLTQASQDLTGAVDSVALDTYADMALDVLHGSDQNGSYPVERLPEILPMLEAAVNLMSRRGGGDLA